MTVSDRLLGYFAREAAPAPEAFTGERMTAAVGGGIETEHYHRYLFARAFCEGCDVLDVASGEGYGSAQIAQVARRVVGVEYAGPTARHAQASFRRPNLHYVQGDARALPLRDDCADVIISFETIEHIAGQYDFLHEVRRVLRPGGRFIVSTPDRACYAPPFLPTNPYHVRELSRHEFEAMLAGVFAHVKIVAQRAFIGSAVVADTPSGAAPLVFERRGERFEACQGLPHAPYLLAVASDVPVPDLPPSLYLARSDVDTDAGRAADALRHLEAAHAEAAAARAEAERCLRVAAERETALVAALHTTERAAAEASRRAEALAEELSLAQAGHAQANARAADLMAELHQLGGSARLFLRSYLQRLWQRG